MKHNPDETQQQAIPSVPSDSTLNFMLAAQKQRTVLFQSEVGIDNK